MEDELSRQAFAVLKVTNSPQPAEETHILPLVGEGGGGIPHPLSLTQRATLSARLLVTRRLISYAKTCLLGWHSEEIVLALVHSENLRTELIVNR